MPSLICPKYYDLLLILLLSCITPFATSRGHRQPLQQQSYRKLTQQQTDYVNITSITTTNSTTANSTAKDEISEGDAIVMDPYLHDFDNIDQPSCNDILLHESIEDRCYHANNCEGEYIMITLLPLAFCTTSRDNYPPLLIVLFPILFPLSLFILTLLLFRLLGSTAENYFSPSLEMIATEFNVPPQLAGVTLLALGNGAPDVSAVVNAIKMNASEGVALSLGELTGGGMFVQTIVVGRIVFLGSVYHKNSAGTKVLGVACRQDLLRDISMYALSAAYVFWLCHREVIYYRHIVIMLLLYCAYVAVVVLSELRSYYTKSLSEEDEDINNDEKDFIPDDESTASSYNEEDEDLLPSPMKSKRVTSDEISHNPNQRQLDPPGIKQTARVLRLMHKQKQRNRQRLLEKRKSLGVDTISESLDRPFSNQQRDLSIHLFRESLRELGQHFYKALYLDIITNSQLSKFERLCMILEIPFIALRKLVIPIPSEDYNRSLLAYSITLSPLWISWYLTTKVDAFDPFCTSNNLEYCFTSVIFPCCISLIIGCAVLKYAPATDLPLRYSLPVSLYGFVIAASFIDVISDQLVNVLEFIGVCLRIPSTIMGMTVLAWGNSVGDYTTNGALAAKGLGDMSMAACFAGPSFNLLIGLGSGLLTQKEALLSDEGLSMALMPSVRTGFLLLLSNCLVTIVSGLWYRGVIPKTHGYLFWAIYLGYMTLSAQHLTQR